MDGANEMVQSIVTVLHKNPRNWYLRGFSYLEQNFEAPLSAHYVRHLLTCPRSKPEGRS